MSMYKIPYPRGIFVPMYLWLSITTLTIVRAMNISEKTSMV